MKTPVPDYLAELLDSVREDASGAVADYIPTLAAADPERLAVALTTCDGVTYAAGDTEAEFTIQSMSKPFTFAAALMDSGARTVAEHIDVEPSGEAFNALSLDAQTGRPRNPMINSGAITAHSLLVGPGASREERVARVRGFYSCLAGRTLGFDDASYEAELATAQRNLAIGHMLANVGILRDDPHEVVAGYIAQCSVLVTVRDIAMMGAVLANGGVHPVSGERLVPSSVARAVLSVMVSSGMYDAAGTWFVDVGLPAKSGVSGGVLGALPGQVGLGAFSPRLDDHGNSVRGVRLFRRMSRDMGLHVMETAATGSRALRSVTASGDVAIVTVQDTVNFAGAEAILRRLDEATPAEPTVVFDLTGAERFTDVGRRMLLEGMRRLHAEGKRVGVHDPDGILPDPDMGNGVHAESRTVTRPDPCA